MDKTDNATLLNLLKNDGTNVYVTESHRVEFKSDFNWGDGAKRAKYCKSMAALCNNEGGYILFGIEDETGKILGASNFDEIDAANLADHLNNYFSPAFHFHKTSIEIASRKVGVIYIERYKDIPTICIKEYDKVLKDGAIYYRYSAKSDFISGTDLIHFLHQLKGKNDTELINIEHQKRKDSVKPIFISDSGNFAPKSLSLGMKNIGKRAKITRLVFLNPEMSHQGKQPPFWIEEHQALGIGGISTVHIQNFSYSCEVHFEDLIGTKYSLIVKGTGAKFEVGDPQEIS